MRPFTPRERGFIVAGAVAVLVSGAVFASLGRSRPGSRAVSAESGPPAHEFGPGDGPVVQRFEEMRRAGEPTSLREAAARGAPRFEDDASHWIALALVPLELAIESRDGGEPHAWPWRDRSWDDDEANGMSEVESLLPVLEPFVYERTDDSVRIASAGHFPEDEAPTAEDLRESVLVWELKR